MNEYIEILTKRSESSDNKTEMFTFKDIFASPVINLGKINIPIFQRNYSWDDEQLIDFTAEYDKYFESFIKMASRDMPTKLDDEKDIRKAAMRNTDLSTFFGPIYILKQHNSLTKIIDGQQRITTLFIFFVYQWYFLKKYEKEIKYSIDKIEDAGYKKDATNLFNFLKISLKRFIFIDKNKNKLFDNSRFQTENINDKKIWNVLFKILDGSTFMDLSLENEEFNTFKDFKDALTKKLTTSKKDSENRTIINSKIFNAFIYAENYFIDQIKKIGMPDFSGIDYLQKINSEIFTKVLIMFIFTLDFSDNFKVAIFNLNKEDYISKIFENINAKGTQLTPFDLLKNSIYQAIKKEGKNLDDNEFAQEISEIENLIKETYKNLDNNDYLLDFYKGLFLNNLVKVDEVNKANIFEKINQILKSGKYSKDPKLLIYELKLYFKNYCDIFPRNPEEYLVLENEKNLPMYNDFRVINNLNYKVLKSMLIGMVTVIDLDEKLKNKEILKAEATNFIKKMSYIYLINIKCKNKKANWHDNKFREISKDFCILKNINKVVEKLIISDEKTEDKNLDLNLMELFQNKKKWIEYVDKICEEIMDTKSEIFKDNGVPKAFLQEIFFNNIQSKNEIIRMKYELEHVLPLKPKSNYVLDSNYDYLKYSMGNMILLSKKINQSLSNLQFNQKLEKVYKNKAFLDVSLLGLEHKIFDKSSIKTLKKFGESEIDNRKLVIKTEIHSILTKI